MGEKLLWHENIFLYMLYFSYFLYAFSYLVNIGFGLNKLANFIRILIKLYTGGILVLKFNSFSDKRNFSKFDRKLAFQAGLFLFTTSLISLIFFDETNLINQLKKNFNY